jgi:hypothetical protein
MFFIHFNEIQEEASMEKNSKRKTGIGRPIFDLQNILQRSQWERNGQRRDKKSEVRGINPKEEFIQGDQS